MGRLALLMPDGKNGRGALKWTQKVSVESGTNPMTEQISDGVLIQRYLNGDEKAFETLMQRHYNASYQHFLKHCRHPDNAADLTQQLWMQMVRHLEHYRDDGKFPAYLMRCATNLLTDHWRRKGVKDKVMATAYTGEQQEEWDNAGDPAPTTDENVELNEQIDLLTTKLIPSLPCEQRLVFLIKHESEYWEEKQRLSWQHLAKLNGMEVDSAWRSFEQARNRLLAHATGAPGEDDTDCDAILLFLVWTQAQRPSKLQDYTWSYFADILNIPENTLKTRYRAALKSLTTGLTELNRHE